MVSICVRVPPYQGTQPPTITTLSVVGRLAPAPEGSISIQRQIPASAQDKPLIGTFHGNMARYTIWGVADRETDVDSCKPLIGLITLHDVMVQYTSFRIPDTNKDTGIAGSSEDGQIGRFRVS